MIRHLPKITIAVSAILSGGCRSPDRMASSAVGRSGISESATQGVFVAYSVQTESQRQPDAKSKPTAAQPQKPQSDEHAPDQQLDSKKEKQENDAPAPRGYTAPSAAIRQAALLAIAMSSVEDEGESGVAGGGKELAESMLGAAPASAASNVVGRPGLTAPQPTVAGAVVSRPGLQEGPAAGIGFASPFNILTPQVNPLSGPMGRCNDLVRAGFFGGSEAACLRHFRPQ